jgi:hypothetical protein
MKPDIYTWLHGVLLGAVIMLVVMQSCDVDKNRDRFDRSMAVWAEQRELYARKPFDAERILHLSEKALAISKERESDPWIIRNLSFITSALIFAAVGVGWLRPKDIKKKDA